jgi:hypothetical protein
MDESWFYFCQGCWAEPILTQAVNGEVHDASKSGFTCGDLRLRDGTLIMSDREYLKAIPGDAFLGVLGADGKFRRNLSSLKRACGRPAKKVLVLPRVVKDANSVDQAFDENLGVSSQLSVDEFFGRLLRSEHKPDDDTGPT